MKKPSSCPISSSRITPSANLTEKTQTTLDHIQAGRNQLRGNNQMVFFCLQKYQCFRIIFSYCFILVCPDRPPAGRGWTSPGWQTVRCSEKGRSRGYRVYGFIMYNTYLNPHPSLTNIISNVICYCEEEDEVWQLQKNKKKRRSVGCQGAEIKSERHFVGYEIAVSQKCLGKVLLLHVCIYTYVYRYIMYVFG